ncbi:MAG: flavin reductase [Dactylosporangium sp.]|nr:flavin reductase [Dactylosporangium sp.]
MTLLASHVPAAPIEPDLFRRMLRHQAASVVVVTAPGERPAGFTATSFTSVSLRPPLVSFCLDRGSSSWPTVEQADYVGVHILSRGQEQVARTFATSGIDRFAVHDSWRAGPHQVPLLDGALAWLVCRVAQRVHAGDHVIVLAEPVLGEHADDETYQPLVYHNGRYTDLR